MLAIEVTLCFGVYDAARTLDPGSGEWPPSPSRVFCALVAGDPDDEEWAALRWLEAQSLPEVHCAKAIATTNHRQFVITNETKAGSPLRPGRTAASRRKPSVFPEVGRFAVVWPSSQPRHSTLAALQRLARRVPYVGRSTSQARVEIATDLPVDAGWSVVEPASLAEFDHDLGVPYEGYSEALRETFEAGRHAWEGQRTAPYRVRRDPVPAAASPAIFGPLARLLVLDCGDSGAYVQQTARMTGALRDAVMSRVVDPLPRALSGHGADDRGHVGFLVLPNIGSPATLPDSSAGWRFRAANEHADGRVLGFALSIPVDLEATDVKQILAAFEAPWDLYVPTGGRSAPRITIRRQLAAQASWGRSVERWTRPSTIWATATPVVFDRHPDGRSEEEMVAQALVTAGYPAPVRVVAQRAPILPGSASHSPSSVLRRAGARSAPYCHAWVEFDLAVEGPVVAGAMRYRGLGLFAPLNRALDEGAQP